MGGGRKVTPASTDYERLNTTPKGQRPRNIYNDRLRQFTDKGQYAPQNLMSMMTLAMEDSEDYVTIEHQAIPMELGRPPFDWVVKQPFKPGKYKGSSFGPSWATHWFKIHTRVPERFKHYERVQFNWDSNSEAMVYLDGVATQGLTGGGERVEWIFPEEWKKDSGWHTFYIEMACNGMFGNALGDSIQPPTPDRTFKLSQAAIVAPNLDAWKLFIDFWEIGDAAREFPADSWEAHKATAVANAIMDVFEVGNQESILKGLKIAEEYLGSKRHSPDVYNGDQEALVFATGHCHIDTAWLWPFDETKRKVARSWSSQCNLMDMYPEYRFSCSSAQQFKWLEQYYPKTFENVRRHVHEGKFQYIGGSWVEHDTNMPSGESLTRQFLLGQRYFESRFGARCQTFWLPDTFGYSAQLPQICRLSGMTRFFTQKLSWNNVNNFPHTTFNWVALDNSQVICHMPPSETYTADANFGDVLRSMSKHKSLDTDNTSLLVFGKGDGGGGPTMQMIEKLRRCRGISDTIGRLPRVHMGASVDDFFAVLEKKNETKKFVTWYGELYLEFHRGTYTTQANNKKWNRHAEIMMRDLETMAAYASLKAEAFSYPKKEIDEMWEDICLMQFHDCLPGSCIEMVYRDTDKIYKALFEKGKELMKNVEAAIGLYETGGQGRAAVGVNLQHWPVTELVKVPTTSDPSTQCTNDGQQYAFARCAGRLSDSIDLCNAANSPCVTIAEHADVFIVDNGKIKLSVGKDGTIGSLIFRDGKKEREVIPKGKKANQLVIFDDKPLYWQAWDVEVYHFESRKELHGHKVTMTEHGPLRVTLLVETTISDKSWIKTEISLDAQADSAGNYVSFNSTVEWHETMKFLKVEFPVDVTNTEASYETQYGVLKRATHYNTSWDMAKFEVCCHRWADLSEHGFGVSVLNDSKYGFATSGNTMRLSLLRSPKAPDAHADMGTHHFRYAMYPHSGSLGPDTVQLAANFNNPVSIRYVPWSQIDAAQNILETVQLHDPGSIVLDCVKRGEDDEDVSTGGLPVRKGKSLIVRLYESMGGRASTVISTDLPVKKAWKTNLLEDDEEEVEITEVEVNGKRVYQIGIDLRVFEVGTYRLQL